MAATPPPSYTPAPEQPVRNQRATFSVRVDAFVTWFIGAIGQVASMATNCYNNAVEAFNCASAANEKAGEAAASAADAQAAVTAAAAAAGADKWISGAAYAEGVVRWSPSNYLPYRRKAPGGISNTDPADDAAGWESQTKSVAIMDEGGNLVAHASSINIVGDLITATAVGGNVTLTVTTPTANQLNTPTIEDAWAIALAI